MIDRQTRPGEYIPPAFPTGIITDDKGMIIGGSNGMSLRDYFAAKAMTSILLAASTTENIALLITERAKANNFELGTERWMADSAYAMADAMLKAREA